MDKQAILRVLIGKTLIASFVDGEGFPYEYHYRVDHINAHRADVHLVKLRYTTSWGEWRDNETPLMCNAYKERITNDLCAIVKRYLNHRFSHLSVNVTVTTYDEYYASKYPEIL